MDYINTVQNSEGGFNFDFAHRNELINEKLGNN
jgi:hypothetical protein